MYSMKATLEQRQVVLRSAQVCCNVRHNSMTPMKGQISGKRETSVLQYSLHSHYLCYHVQLEQKSGDKARLGHECSEMCH